MGVKPSFLQISSFFSHGIDVLRRILYNRFDHSINKTARKVCAGCAHIVGGCDKGALVMEERHNRLRTGLLRFFAQDLPVVLGVLAVLFAAMSFTGGWPTKSNEYRTYALQACAWLEGRLDLGRDYPWLELAIYEGKYFVSFPPFPSVVLLPFCAIFGSATPDHLIALAVTVVGVVFALRLCRRVAPQSARGSAAFLTLFLYLSNGYMHIGLQGGWVWHLAQCMCFTLSLMALSFAAEGKGTPSLACWAFAVGCRPMVAVYLPLLACLLYRAHGKQLLQLARERWYWAVCPTVIALGYMALNYARFGNILEFGRSYLPEFTRTQTGQFDFSYVLNNLQSLVRLPRPGGENGALRYYTFECQAFWLITPLIVVTFVAWLCRLRRHTPGQRFTLITVPLMALLHLIILLLHRTLGGWQFGNRYLLDMLPYLFCALLMWMPRSETFRLWCIPPALLGAAVNLIGTVATYNSWITGQW